MLDVALPSGIVFSDAVGMLHRKFELWPWERYDGDPPSDCNHVRPADVARVYRLGARTSRTIYGELLRSHGAKVNRLLRKLPTSALEDTDLAAIRVVIEQLFDLLLGQKGVKLAGATKLLYPFRPALLPVIDSVVDYYYWYATSIRDEQRFRVLQSATWGTYVYELLLLMQADVRGAQHDIDRLLAACAGQPYAAASRVRVVESLLWFYYARGGRVPTDEV
jgi:hypothetical protein